MSVDTRFTSMLESTRRVSGLVQPSAEGNRVVGDEGGTGEKEHDAAGQHDDQRLFAAERCVLEKPHKP